MRGIILGCWGFFYYSFVILFALIVQSISFPVLAKSITVVVWVCLWRLQFLLLLFLLPCSPLFGLLLDPVTLKLKGFYSVAAHHGTTRFSSLTKEGVAVVRQGMLPVLVSHILCMCFPPFNHNHLKLTWLWFYAFSSACCFLFNFVAYVFWFRKKSW